MKRSIFLSIILSLFLVACIPQAMAQKQSRLEKLLRYLNDNDADKWQKNRDKIDDETQTYYSEELALLDVLNELWHEQSEQAATNYFGCYERAAKAYFPNICEEEKIQFSNVQDKAEQAVISILEASKEQIPFSKTLMDSIQSNGYLSPIVYQRILGNNQKTSGCLTCLYDKYGNRIDGNSYYEYDNTEQWISRTSRDNPKEMERIQYLYK